MRRTMPVDEGRSARGLSRAFCDIKARVEAGRSLRIRGVLGPAGPLRRCQLFEVSSPAPGRPGVVRVRVRGNALSSDGIRDGDSLVLDTRGDLHDGQTILAEVGGTTMLRRFRAGRVEARETEALPFLTVSEPRIHGAVVGILRKQGFGARGPGARGGDAHGGGIRCAPAPAVVRLDGRRARRLRALEQSLRAVATTYATTEHPRLRRALRDEAAKLRRAIDLERTRDAWAVDREAPSLHPF
jgi:Peptidase S24-like